MNHGMFYNVWLSNANSRRRFSRLFLLLFGTLLLINAGCTSLGHEGRAQPQFERNLKEVPKSVAVVGAGELAIAVELMLVSQGVRVYPSPIQSVRDKASNSFVTKTVTRYVVNVSSTDLDVCLPEGSRQMHFSLSVADIVENQRVFAMSGDYGCKDTIINRFKHWYFN